jgi:hypothetical protein
MEGSRLLRHLRLHRRKRMVKPPQAPRAQALPGRKAALKAADTVAPVVAGVEAIAAPVAVAAVVTVAVEAEVEAAIAVAVAVDASAVPVGVPAADRALATATFLDARCVLSAWTR